MGGSMAPGKIVLIVAGFLFVGLISFGLFSSDFYSSLGRPEQVRGLITFLFVLVATSIILVFALGIFWLDSNEVTKRFAAMKDLLTIVVGIVGTIMGFYFGSATSDTAKLSISDLSPPVVHTNESVNMTGQITGGTKPYKYTVVFTDPGKALTPDDLAKLNFDGDSKDGKMSKDMKGPAIKNDVAAVAKFTVTVTDAKNGNATSNGTLYLEPAKKVP